MELWPSSHTGSTKDSARSGRACQGPASNSGSHHTLPPEPDVHKKTVVACLRFPGPKGKFVEEVQTFGTTTRELLQLADWLRAAGCTHVAMESTGVYWRSVYRSSKAPVEHESRAAFCSSPLTV